MIQVLIKPYKIVKKRIDYQLHKEAECKNIQETGVLKKRSMSLQKVNVIKVVMLYEYYRIIIRSGRYLRMMMIYPTVLMLMTSLSLISIRQNINY